MPQCVQDLVASLSFKSLFYETGFQNTVQNNYYSIYLLYVKDLAPKLPFETDFLKKTSLDSLCPLCNTTLSGQNFN